MWTLISLSMLVVVAAAVWLMPQVTPATRASGPQVMDFVRSPYLHAEPDGILFGESRLVDYALSSDSLSAGDTLQIDMTWASVVADSEARIRLLNLNAHLFNPAPIWAQASEPLSEGEVSVALALPDGLAPGEYALRLDVLVDGDALRISSASGADMGKLSLAPVRIVGHSGDSNQMSPIARFGPEQQLPVISLLETTLGVDEEEHAVVDLIWGSERQAPLNYYLSVRLRDASGEQIASRDVPPLLGGYPTSLWQPGEAIHDRVLIKLPDDAALDSDTQVEIVLYDRLTLKGAGTAIVEDVLVD